jgi:hypothetical protein
LQTGAEQDDFHWVAAQDPEQVIGTLGEAVGHDRVERAMQPGSRLPYTPFKPWI